MKNVLILIATISFGFFLYIIFFRKPISQWYCRKQINFKKYSFQQAVKKNGAPEKVEVSKNLTQLLEKMYENCLTH